MDRFKNISRRIAPNRNWSNKILLLAFVFLAILFPLLTLVALNFGEDKSAPPALSACNLPTTAAEVAKSTEPTDAQLSELEDTVLDIKDWLSINFDYTITCAGFGEIDWADFSSKLDRVAEEYALIEDDAQNGKFDNFTSADIERTISNARCLMSETNRLCGFPE